MSDEGLVLLAKPGPEAASPAAGIHAALSAKCEHLGLTRDDDSRSKFKQTADGAYEVRVVDGADDQRARKVLNLNGWHVVGVMARSDWEATLWSAEQAAAYWEVSVSRARAILASRKIQRVSGYPSEQIKHVKLRQGARTDLRQ